MHVRDATVETVSDALLREGYVVVEGVLTPDNVAHKRRELAGLLADTPFGGNSFLGRRTRRVFMLLAKMRCFDDAVLNPLLLGLLDRLLVHYQLSVSTAIEIHPGEEAQTLHRDDSVYPLPTEFGPLAINSMWALTDFTTENGATRLIPASHQQPDLTVKDRVRTSESRFDDLSDAEFVADMPAGSVLVYLGNLLHGGGANQSLAPRLGVVLEYAVSWIRPQENLGLGYPPALARTLPARLQELLGYNLYPPFLGYVDGKDPIELLH